MKTRRWKKGEGMWLVAAGTVLIVGAVCWSGAALGQEEILTPSLAPSQPADMAATTEPSPEIPAEEVEKAEVKKAEAERAEAEKRVAALWDDFLHGIKVAREDLAESTGRAILESGASPRQIYLLSVKERDIQWLLTRGEKLKGLSPIIADIRAMIEEGYHAERSDPNQIANSIELLGKNLRAYEIGAGRLVTSGEYALPQLVQKLTDPTTSATLTERIISVLPRLGKDAVRPLSAALEAKDQALIQTVAEVLGKIHYAEAAPALKELLERQDLVDRTRQVAATALVACGGEAAKAMPVSSLLYEQAEKYYYDRHSIPPDPNAPTANVWFWREGLGLEMVAVPREIFGDLYAMRLAKAALKYDASFHPAVSLWLAAKIRKEIHLPPGQRDPTEQADAPTARFYALAGSARYLQDVLHRALRDEDAALALKAIEALAETAGAQSLVEPIGGGVQPLVMALANRDGQVRMLAALTLANALPQKHFEGAERVVAVLNEALRQRGQRKALLIDADPEHRNSLKDALRTAGFEVIDEPNPDKAIAAAREASGVDLVVLGANPSPTDFIARMRVDPATAALPAVVAHSDEKLQRLAKQDGAVVLLESTDDAAKVSEAIDQAVKKTSLSAPTSEQATSLAVRAAEAIARLGETSNPVYDISKTVGTLTSALADQQPGMAMAAAKALATLSAPQAQQALADRAVTETLDLGEKTQVDLLRLLAGSLRRFGNLLGDPQATAIINTVTDAKQPQAVREAAAQVLGAMNLPSEKIKVLIVGGAG